MSSSGLATVRHRGLSDRTQEGLAGYLMSLPALLILTTFILVPIVASLVLVFMDYPLLTPPVWAGLGNLRHLFLDKRLWLCYWNTLYLTTSVMILNNVVGLLLAMGVNRTMPRLIRYFLRSSLFFPVLTTTSSLALVWSFLLTKDRGVINWLIGQVGLAPIPWLSRLPWARYSVILFDLWRGSGFSMVLYLAGLQGIPEGLYEAARIDGANRWQLTRHITLPLITPTLFFCAVMGSIASFQMFDGPFVMTGGGPGDTTRTISMYIYEIGFQRFQMGYASAIAVLLLVFLLLLTVIQFRLADRWVHYE